MKLKLDQDSSGGMPPAAALCLFLAGVSVPILIPYFQFGFVYTFWPMDMGVVDRVRCKCGCWDTIFKGSYEAYPSGYHHMYFNVTWQSLCIWVIVVLGVVASYEMTRRVAQLIYQRSLRWPMAALLVASVFPHYYGWWMSVNMWNDDFYDQWVHQLYFSATEALSTSLIFRLCDTRRPLPTPQLLTISTIGAFHVMAGSWDQFVQNVLLGKGKLHQQSRDVAFVALDLINVVVCVIYLVTLRHDLTRRQLGWAALTALLMTYVTTWL